MGTVSQISVKGQLDLFSSSPFGAQARILTRAEEWADLGYDGPAPGRLCDIDSIVVDLEGGGLIYTIFEQARLIELRPDGRWLAEIAMGEVHGKQWSKNGTRVLLCEDDIWPPMRQPYERRNDITEKSEVTK